MKKSELQKVIDVFGEQINIITKILEYKTEFINEQTRVKSEKFISSIQNYKCQLEIIEKYSEPVLDQQGQVKWLKFCEKCHISFNKLESYKKHIKNVHGIQLYDDYQEVI